MQLVLPKGKVEANPFAVFSPRWASLQFSNFLTMEITVNHQKYELNTECSVGEMLTSFLQIDAKNIAVAINQQIIPKAHWHNQVLMPGDQVLLIKATQGG